MEFYAGVEPSVVHSKVMSVLSDPTLCTQGFFLYFRTMRYYRPSLLLGVQLKWHCKIQRSTSLSSTVSVLLLIVVFVTLTYLYV